MLNMIFYYISIAYPMDGKVPEWSCKRAHKRSRELQTCACWPSRSAPTSWEKMHLKEILDGTGLNWIEHLPGNPQK